nr:GNAT family N-acetyltransferase [Acidiferrobacterales bacterium]
SFKHLTRHRLVDMLFDHAGMDAIDRGAKVMALGVLVANKSAVSAYSRLGFTVARYTMEKGL